MKEKKSIRNNTIRKKTQRNKTIRNKTIRNKTIRNKTIRIKTIRKNKKQKGGYNLDEYENKLLGIRLPYYGNPVTYEPIPQDQGGVLIPTGELKTFSKDPNVWFARGVQVNNPELEQLTPRDSTPYYLITGNLTNEQLTYFKRDIPSPMDCVISAMQLGGILSNECANLMRLTAIGHQGMLISQLEQMFVYLTNSIVRFVPLELENLLEYLFKALKPQEIAFCAYSREIGSGHAYIIGKGIDSQLYLIDPLAKTPLCKLGNIDYILANRDSDHETCIPELIDDTYTGISHDGKLMGIDSKFQINTDITKNIVKSPINTWYVLGQGPEITDTNELRKYLRFS